MLLCALETASAGLSVIVRRNLEKPAARQAVNPRNFFSELKRRNVYNLEQVALTFNAYWMRFAEITGAPKGQWWAKLEESGFLPHLRTAYYPKLGFALKPKRHE
jgi:hypothetical protein